jgi:hypothetical protein
MRRADAQALFIVVLQAASRPADSSGDMTKHEERPRMNGSDEPVMFVGGFVVRFFGAVCFLGGLALIVAGIVNIVHLHDRAGGMFGIVLGLLFVVVGRYVWRLPLAKQERREGNGRGVVPENPMNHRGPSIRRKMMLLGILAPIFLTAGVTGLLWCRRSGATYCHGPGGLLAYGVVAIIGAIYWYRRRD